VEGRCPALYSHCMANDIPDSNGAVILIAYVVFQTILLGLYLTIFQPGLQGRFAPRGSFAEWMICLLFNCVMAVFAELPKIFLIILWWTMALWVLRLSIRQTLKLNIALGLFYLAMIVGAVSLLNSK
jgi:hypothetical protein